MGKTLPTCFVCPYWKQQHIVAGWRCCFLVALPTVSLTCWRLLHLDTVHEPLNCFSCVEIVVGFSCVEIVQGPWDGPCNPLGLWSWMRFQEARMFLSLAKCYFKIALLENIEPDPATRPISSHISSDHALTAPQNLWSSLYLLHIFPSNSPV